MFRPHLFPSCLALVLLCFMCGAAAAQGTGDFGATLDRIDQTSQTAASHLQRLRIEKWKMDSESKSEAQSNSASILRNLTSALPGIVAEVRANPNSLQSNFKLYRTLVALYDVMAPLAATGMASGPKDDGNALISDSQALDDVRRVLGDRIILLSSAMDAELARLRQSAKAAAVATPPKRIIVDDNEPSPRKKRTAPKAAKPAAPANSTPNPSN